MQNLLQGKKGFTLVELMLVVGIIGILLGLVSINLVKAQHNASVSATVDQIVSDMHAQQIKAMTGANDGSGNGNSYGIYFGTTSYTLFTGTMYSPGSLTNFTINLTNGSEFTNILFPNSSVIFNQLSGEVNGFVTGKNTVTIKNISGTEQKTITVNRYGIVNQIQ